MIPLKREIDECECISVDLICGRVIVQKTLIGFRPEMRESDNVFHIAVRDIDISRVQDSITQYYNTVPTLIAVIWTFDSR
jgi:hypothetical protein